MPHDTPDWDTCTATEPNGDPCIGVQVHAYQRCLRHLAREELTDVLDRWTPGENVDLRGTTITEDLISKILTAVTDPDSGQPRLGIGRFEQAQFRGLAMFSGVAFSGDAKFDRAQFGGDISVFANVQFSGHAQFSGAQFSGDAQFGGAQFHRDAQFSGAQFSGHAWFTDAQFSKEAGFARAQFSKHATFTKAQLSGNAGFSRAQFSGNAGFSGAQFSGNAGFSGAQFSGDARFDDAQFKREARFDDAQFSGDARFDEAQFKREAWFGKAQFKREARFYGAQFSRDAWFLNAQFSSTEFLGPLTVGRIFSLDNALFERSVLIQAAAAAVACRDTRFGAEANLRLRYALVSLDNATCATLMTVAAIPQQFTLWVADADKGEERQPMPEDAAAGAGTGTAIPRLLSLGGVDASRLVLTDIDLSECQFVEARQLDKIRIEGDSRFAKTPHPGRWGWTIGRAWPHVWRWSARRVLAEEHAWRATTGKKQGWTRPTTQAPTAPLGPARLAVLYRELRKAQEDRGNEPGAADFYYGEMEMRRHSPATPLSERFVLAAYWAISGYGLRATRALLVLAATIAVSALLLQHHGFTAPIHPSFLNTLLYSTRATLSLDVKAAHFPDTLTPWGQVLRIILRIAGPLCLGLAALALRGRVKR